MNFDRWNHHSSAHSHVAGNDVAMCWLVCARRCFVESYSAVFLLSWAAQGQSPMSVRRTRIVATW